MFDNAITHVPGWADIFNAINDFELQTKALREQCQQNPTKHSNLMLIIDKQLALLDESKTLYDKYTNTSPENRGWWFGIYHLASITQIAKGFIDLKPADPENEEDLKFALNFIHFLETLKNLNKIPSEIGSLLSLLRTIINFYLPEMKVISEQDLLFKALLDKAINTQKFRISKYAPQDAVVANINTCNAYNMLDKKRESTAEIISGSPSSQYRII